MTSTPVKYLLWHYLKKTKQILSTIKNFLAFGAYFFSAKEMLFSLFSPWKRQTENFGRGFDPAVYFRVLGENLIAIIIGFVVRAFFLVIFLVFEMAVIIIGGAVFLIWIFLPILTIAGIVCGIRLIFNYV
ncbi:MAG: hypothetical protein WC470_02065 [Candidatus Paceibacterota bacterium]